jgi:hypothetical protein
MKNKNFTKNYLLKYSLFAAFEILLRLELFGMYPEGTFRLQKRNSSV